MITCYAGEEQVIYFLILQTETRYKTGRVCARGDPIPECGWAGCPYPGGSTVIRALMYRYS